MKKELSNLEQVKRKIMARPATHQPTYTDTELVSRVVNNIEQMPDIVEYNQITALKHQMAEIAKGNGFLLQMGPCVQGEFDTPEQIQKTNNAMAVCKQAIEEITGQKVVSVGRHFNYAKPRSNNTEIIEGVEMETYKGSSVNGSSSGVKNRRPNPNRMQTMSAKTRFVVKDVNNIKYHSHEALLLPFELADLREADDGQVYSSGAHMLWVGHRTRDMGNAHVEFASSIDNPVGIKIGPDVNPEELKDILDKLDDSKKQVGKVTLIFRMGADNVYKKLPRLLDAVEESGHKPVLISDPMHGNTKNAKGKKTRYTHDIIAEMNGFAKIVCSRGMHVGGVMLEAVGEGVTECVGYGVRKRDLNKITYQSECDPCLNPYQALSVMKETSEVLALARKVGKKEDSEVRSMAFVV